MKIIQKYQAEDGSIFNTPEECKLYDELLENVNKVLGGLYIANDTDCHFSNGGGYIQHPKGTKAIIKLKLLVLFNEWFKPEEPAINFTYYVGRRIDDSGVQCLNLLSTKLMCIDDNDREWGQPYYAINPSKGEQIQLNKQ